VVIDPRRTATCELADLHLPVKPGTDVWLFNGLLSYLAKQGVVDAGFVAAHTEGLDAALAVAERRLQRPGASGAHLPRRPGQAARVLRSLRRHEARSSPPIRRA
jgi:anaerobic selenocysteine-containing dehydrogenase